MSSSPSRQPDNQPTASHVMSHQRSGWLPRMLIWIRGERVRDLTEQTHPMPFASYMLTVLQSIAVVLALGHSELVQLLAGQSILSSRLIDGGALLLLVATVFIADYAAIRSMERLATLSRNRSVMLFEHLAFVGFLLVLEMATLGVVLAALDQNPATLVTGTGTAIIPASGVFFLAQVGLRSVLIVWTMIQLFIISQPLPVQWTTLEQKAMKLLGGHAQEKLESLQLSQDDIGELFESFAMTTRRSPHRITWWNRWLVERERDLESREAAHQQDVVHALRRLSQSRDERVASVLVAEAGPSQENLAQQVANEVAAALQYYAQHREFPAKLIEVAPQLGPLEMLSAVKLSPAAPSQPSTTRKPSGRTDAQRRFLRGLGIDPAPPPQGKRGVWLSDSHVAILTDGKLGSDEASALISRVGKGAESGTAHVALFEPVMAELYQRRVLSGQALTWWLPSGFGLVAAGNNGTRERPPTVDSGT